MPGPQKNDRNRDSAHSPPFASTNPTPCLHSYSARPPGSSLCDFLIGHFRRFPQDSRTWYSNPSRPAESAPRSICTSKSEKPIGRQRKVSRFGWRGLPQKERRITEMRYCRYIGAVFCNCFVQSVGICSKELVGWTTACDLPALTAWSKTPPRPLREALRMGVGRAGWRRRPFRTASCYAIRVGESADQDCSTRLAISRCPLLDRVKTNPMAPFCPLIIA